MVDKVGVAWLAAPSTTASHGTLWRYSTRSRSKVVTNRQQPYGVFLSYCLSHNTFAEAKSFDYALIGGLNFGCAMLVAPIATGVCRRTGIRPMVTAGAFIFGGGCIAASFIIRVWHLDLCNEL